MIKETIVVEGRDDEIAVRRAVEANVICTHGFGIRRETYDLIALAYEKQGIIIFTDPDFSGEEIRRKLTARFPGAKQAYISLDKAEKSGDIGVENAKDEDIIFALNAAKAEKIDLEKEFDENDMFELGLCGSDGSAALRQAVGSKLGIGSGNSGAFLRRLNAMGIKREELMAAWESSVPQKR